MDDVYAIEDILSDETKDKYSVHLASASLGREDVLHIGYLKLKKLAAR